MDSFIAPIIFLFSIGIAIVLNLGSNMLMGEISYVTKALAAVLQLGVTMDYSIFLWHSYQEQQVRFQGDKERAMAHAISNTVTSVAGSSITTLAGFIALCFMSFTLGLDLGIVMAKGVLLGVITCITVLPSLLLVFDKLLEKTKHKKLLPSLEKPMKFVNKHYIILAILFVLIWIPAIWGHQNTNVYYDLAGTLPKELQSIEASTALQEQYNMNCVDMILLDKTTPTNKVNEMTLELENVEGVVSVIGLDGVIGPVIPEDMVPETMLEIFESENYKMIVALSKYKAGSDESNNQVEVINQIVKKYDEGGMLVGEAPCTKDLIEVTNRDFQVVSAVSIGLVFLIIALLFRSISIPVILISVIEFAIFVNMGIPAFTGTELPFIASVVIGTVQLGATVDYAILMTTRYKKERSKGIRRKEAVSIAHVTSTESVLVSALSFFAATFGVGMYSEIDMISSLCILMARGALISMVVVLLMLPSMLIIFDPIIIRTSIGFSKARKKA
jgi:predicted RND superfamily exporter protein